MSCSTAARASASVGALGLLEQADKNAASNMGINSRKVFMCVLFCCEEHAKVLLRVRRRAIAERPTSSSATAEHFAAAHGEASRVFAV